MNEWFYEKDNKAYIYDEDNKKREETLKHNIKDLLITENNIETIDKMIKNYTSSKENAVKKLKGELIFEIIISSMLKISAVGAFIVAVNILLPMMYLLLIMVLFETVIYDVVIYINTKKNINFINCYDKKIKELNKSLNSEKEKLELIKSKSKEKKVKLTEPVLISKSEIIKNLVEKLDLISCYRENRKELLSCYKNNQSLGFYNQYSQMYIREGMEEMNFIKELIEEDLKNDKRIMKENSKQKVKKLKK